MMDGAEPLADRLTHELAGGKRVLWLVPGGSNIALSTEVSRRLPPALTANLTIMLTDERYGAVGHKDSNTVQLELAGFDPQLATMHAVLQPGLSLDDTVTRYARDYAEAVRTHDTIIGQFGMGPDGHLAGMLPHSAAVRAADLAYGYDAPGFTRITLTPPAIQHVLVAYLFAFGTEKIEALNNLHDKNLSLDEQPTQLLKQIPESYVYNDQI